MRHIEILDLRPPEHVASTHGLLGSLNQTLQSAQRRLLNDFIPSLTQFILLLIGIERLIGGACFCIQKWTFNRKEGTRRPGLQEDRRRAVLV